MATPSLGRMNNRQSVAKCGPVDSADRADENVARVGRFSSSFESRPFDRSSPTPRGCSRRDRLPGASTGFASGTWKRSPGSLSERSDANRRTAAGAEGPNPSSRATRLQPRLTRVQILCNAGIIDGQGGTTVIPLTMGFGAHYRETADLDQTTGSVLLGMILDHACPAHNRYSILRYRRLAKAHCAD